ncbi:MAG: radical SAM family heme chaperone HemW [Bacteroidales bacterium]|nr:radical SAM family heme chaperone HemW [Bacteroidales bacterium]
MSALYIHIPYCKQRCIYCDFYSSATKEDKKDYIDALIQEFKERKSEVKEPIETLYIGGGTPTTLSKEEISYLFKHILEEKELYNLKEITIEANPENLSKDYIEYLKNHTPINRLSIGIQSFDNADLITIGRKHSKEDAILAVKQAQELGFNNISIDLIYNLPQMDKEKWLKNLKTAKDLNIQHISAYSLTVEEKTILHKLIEKGELTLAKEDEQIEQYDLTITYLTNNGFEHYETSSFAHLNTETDNNTSLYRSKHNSSYWNNTPYIGIGASAHSYNLEQRRWNIANIKEYIQKIKNNLPYYEIENLSTKDKYNEYIIIGTRIKEGLNLTQIEANFPPTYATHFQTQIKSLIEKNLIDKNHTNYRLTQEGEHIANTIAIELMR